MLVLALGACSSSSSGDDEVVGARLDGSEITRGEVMDTADADGDGVVSTQEFDEALEEMNATDFDLFIDSADPAEVAASFPGGEVTVGEVVANLEESPPAAFTPGEAPEQGAFVGRLTSMLRLRLTAVALTNLGFPVSLDGTDREISDVVAALIEGDFEAWATEQIISERPEVPKLASPHCLSLVVVPTEQEALDAIARIEGGERVYDVAEELNLENTTEVGGGLGCNDVLAWTQVLGEAADPLEDLEIGEVGPPSPVPAESSPTGELWIVVHVDDILLEFSDPSLLGPFASGYLTDEMMTYSLEIHPEVGDWLAESLSISLPA